jgi:hypothetical protein|tara:strand:- start:2412 stop:3083 length:672 start_codon:yes stop_codon:yes gene_type:complete
VYSRRYDGQLLTFEASGGLINSSLVMQDRETNSYWAIMKGEAIAGLKKGTELAELPLGKKMKWKRWKRKHPDTLVLSVNGTEDGQDSYRSYFRSSQGFRNTMARDKRLKTKAPIFAFKLGEQTYAVNHKHLAEGQSFSLADTWVFLYRSASAELFHSTAAFQSGGKGIEKKDGQWVDISSGCRFDPDEEVFDGDTESCPKAFKGFDTFWYNWSLNNPSTELLM